LLRLQVRFDLPLHSPRDWCNRTVYMFAMVQLVVCYAVAGAAVLFLALAAACHRLSRLVCALSSSSSPPPAANAPTYNGKV